MLRHARTLRPARPASPSIQRLFAAASEPEIFDNVRKAAQRDRAARAPLSPDPLVDTVVDRLLDRLLDCSRSFSKALVVGGSGTQIAARLAQERPKGLTELTYVDTSRGMLSRAESLARLWPRGVLDLECVHWDPASDVLPVRSGSYDVVISCLGLHWINDIPLFLMQCRAALREDGLFLGAMLGGSSLQELRISCSLASQERRGGVSARMSPLAQVRDAGNLLTRAGLALPTVDVDSLQVGYRDCVGLVAHLRAMAEGSAFKGAGGALARDEALAAAAIYASTFGVEEKGAEVGKGAETEGIVAAGGDPETLPAADGVAATFEVIYLTGWAPHASMTKAKARGSATASFDDLARALGEPTEPLA